jgi:DnaJ-class molecular chaperone
MAKSNKNKVICPVCKGNGYVRIPYRLTEEEVTAQCGVCESEGEIYENEIDNIYMDSDGIHSLH